LEKNKNYNLTHINYVAKKFLQIENNLFNKKIIFLK